MARFGKAADKLWQINAAFIGLFAFGPGLAMPVQTSADPPTACMAPVTMYQTVGLIQTFLVPVLATSILLSAIVSYTVGKTLRGMNKAWKRALRATLFVAIGMSMASLGLGLWEYAYIVQAKAMLFRCMSTQVRGGLYACYGVVALLCACGYIRFGITALFEE